MCKGDLRVFLTFIVILQLAANGSFENKLKAETYHLLEKRRAILESKSGHKLAAQSRIGRDAATYNFSKKRRPGKNKISSRNTILKEEDEDFIGRLTDDIHGLVQLLKARKEDKTAYPPVGEEYSEKRNSSAQGSGLSFDLGFIVDGSKVIDEQGSGNFRKCLEFVKEILRSFQVTLGGVHAGLITYGKTSRLHFNFDTTLDQVSVESTIDSVSFPGTESHAGNALKMAMAKLFPHSGRQNVPHILIVITGSSSQDEVESYAEELRAGGINIFCVGVGGRYDQSQLEAIASSPSDTYVITTEFDGLRNVVPLLLSRISTVLGYSTGKPTQAPSDNLLSQGGIVEAKVDLGFLIDGSGTVGEQDYRMSLDFMKAMYSTFWTQLGSIHVGLVVYGATPRLIFDFDNKYIDIVEINNAIDSATYPGGETAVAGEALKTVKADLYGSKHHDSYRRVLVVIIGSTSADDVFLGAEMLKANKVKVFCVGVGSQYEWNQIEGVASEPISDNILTVASYPGLTSLTQTLVGKIEEARTIYIPPQDTSKPRFQRNVSQPGQSLGQTGQGPSTGSSPGTVSPQSGQLRPAVATEPTASATVKPTLTSQLRPVSAVNGQKPVNAATVNRPTGKQPMRPESPIVLPTQGLPSVPVQDTKLDLLFLLDGSSNLQKPGFQASKEFMKKVYSNFPIGEDGVHVGLVIYGNEPRVVFNLIEGKNKQTVDNKMLTATYPNSDGSYLGNGLLAAKKNVFDVSARPGGHQVLLVLSAGKSKDETKTTSRALRDRGVTIFAIGIGNMVDINKLQDIVSAPEEDHLLKTNVEELDRLLSPTVQNIRAVITEPVTQSGPADIKMDLAFLLDTNSAHFRPDHFGNVLNSIKSTYAPFLIGKDNTRVGIVTYGGRPRVAVPLEQYTSKQSLDTAVGHIFVSDGPGFLGQECCAA